MPEESNGCKTPALSRNTGALRLVQQMRRFGFVLVAIFCLSGILTPPLALACGAAFVLLFENPFPQFSKKTSKTMLQICVVLLGFEMDFPKLLRVGVSGWVFAAFSIALTLGLGWLVGRRLRLQRKTSLLISAGTAICGGSAIAAIGPVISASEANMTVAMGTVFMLNAVALYLFPVLGHMLRLSSEQFGLWSGIAIHDISSVVGAASIYGGSALQIATAVKLSRTLWIVPVALAAAIAYRGCRAASDPATSRAKITIPWFIGLFILASLARLLVPGITLMTPTISHFAKLGLTVTLFLVGAGLSRDTLRAAGWKALLQGVCLWIFISGAALITIIYL
ncbi:MAG TPA: putative sulfate exporter family transporter [Tepidisphaeraceae bacterium]|nr:putative sulfate exporter family transporter [Tepidisphaeraceae bacterium]